LALAAGEATRSLPIEGGLPGRKKLIKREDSVATRKGLKGMIKGSSIVSELKVLVTPREGLASQQYTQYLPRASLCNSGLLGLVRHYREYLAYLSFVKGLDVNVHRDPFLRCLMAGLDSP
jgi:hypothetical protein